MSEIARTESKAWSIASLVIGIVSLLSGYTFLVPIIGIIVGVMARRREPSGRVLATWGIWLSVIAMVLGVIIVVLFGGALLAAFGFAAIQGG